MSERPAGRIALALVVSIVLVGAALRIVASFDAFWLDEIWSWRLAQLAGSFGGVWTLAHDNNHQLNTLWMRLLGPDAPWPLYRVLAVVSGIGTIAMAARLAGPRIGVEAVYASALVAFSLYFTAFTSEARGYAPMILFALLAYWSLRRALDRPTMWNCALFAAFSLLGTSSHFAFTHAYGAFVVWSAVRLARPEFRFASWTKRMLALHAIPIAFLIAEYVFFIAEMKIGGGPVLPLAAVLSETLTQGFGAPDGTWSALVVAAGLIAVLIADFVLARRAGSDEWVLTVCAVVVVPALTLVLFQPEFLAPRYFLVSLVFVSLALARVCAELARRGRIQAVIAGAIVLAFVVGNGVRIAKFLETGRGHYREALEHIVAETRAETATLTGPDLFDLKLMLSFYGRALPAAPKIVLYAPNALPPGGTEWVLVVDPAQFPDPPRDLQVGRFRYGLVEVFERYAPSGWNWVLYRRVG